MLERFALAFTVSSIGKYYNPIYHQWAFSNHIIVCRAIPSHSINKATALMFGAHNVWTLKFFNMANNFSN